MSLALPYTSGALYYHYILTHTHTHTHIYIYIHIYIYAYTPHNKIALSGQGTCLTKIKSLISWNSSVNFGTTHTSYRLWVAPHIHPPLVPAVHPPKFQRPTADAPPQPVARCGAPHSSTAPVPPTPQFFCESSIVYSHYSSEWMWMDVNGTCLKLPTQEMMSFHRFALGSWCCS